ncbi:LysE family translocator [Actinomadura sp. WMMA1423]|uniref:LysE family translocator n=1 Tax=Actinomadura sp. WMMA1423 TaxID=2591108 RepID=UPI0011473BD3|nr:LysE family translocator [Actinomadura sp. WMMA1423]
MLTSLLAFLGVSMVVIVTPGPDTAVTISGTFSGGRRGGVSTALGVFCGQALWTLATSAGISALLVASEPAFLAVKYIGSAYLVYLGLHALWSAVRAEPATAATAEPARRRSRSSCFRRGLLSDLGNPKMAVFFSSLLPQFGSHFLTLTVLGLLFCALTLLWLIGYSIAIATMGNVLRRPSIRRGLDMVTGTILVALGGRVAAEPR